MEKTTREKITVQLEEINQKGLAKERRLKIYQLREKQLKKTGHSKTIKENSTKNLDGMTKKTYEQRDAKETERVWTKKHNEKAEWINNMTRELETLEEGPKVEILIELLKKTLKKISNWKTPGHDGIHGFCFMKFTSIHDRLALEMNICLQDAKVQDWMTKGKTTLI